MRSIWDSFCERLTHPVVVGMVSSLLLLGCGGGGTGGGSTTNPSVPTTPTTPSTPVTPAASGIQLLVSAPQTKSDGSQKVDIRVVVTDANGIVVPTKTVTLSAIDTVATGGVFLDTLSNALSQTDANGTLTAKLNVGVDKTNRIVQVKAVVDGKITVSDIAIAGTTLSISGSNAVTTGQSTVLTLTAKDSSGASIPNALINLTSLTGNGIPATVTTDINGQAKITLVSSVAGNDVITVSGLGATATQAVSVSADNFQFLTTSGYVQPDNAVDVATASTTVAVKWLKSGVAQQAQTVKFTVTRGQIDANSVLLGAGASTSSVSVLTDSNGIATAVFKSSQVGSAKIAATGQDSTGSPSASMDISYITSTATSVILQSDSTTLPVNAAGSETYQSRVTATVRDAANNLVKNANVNFSIQAGDTSGSKLSLSSAVTDSSGQASVYLIAGTSAGKQEGVEIRAVVQDIANVVLVTPIQTVANKAAANHDLYITISGLAQFVRIGTGNTVTADGETRYIKQWTAVVTDASGGPVSGKPVQFIIKPMYFFKGTQVYDDTASAWIQVPNNPLFTCPQEDINYDGVRFNSDSSTRDINNDGILTPGNVATVSSTTTAAGASKITLTTGNNGFADVYVIYPKSYARWVEVNLQAKISVEGTESSDAHNFTLPVATSDISQKAVEPPGGVISPYGLGSATLSVTELGVPIDGTAKNAQGFCTNKY